MYCRDLAKLFHRMRPYLLRVSSEDSSLLVDGLRWASTLPPPLFGLSLFSHSTDLVVEDDWLSPRLDPKLYPIELEIVIDSLCERGIQAAIDVVLHHLERAGNPLLLSSCLYLFPLFLFAFPFFDSLLSFSFAYSVLVLFCFFNLSDRGVLPWLIVSRVLLEEQSVFVSPLIASHIARISLWYSLHTSFYSIIYLSYMFLKIGLLCIK